MKKEISFEKNYLTVADISRIISNIPKMEGSTYGTFKKRHSF